MKSSKIFLHFVIPAMLLLCSCEQQKAPTQVFGLADVSLGCTTDCPSPVTIYERPSANAKTLGVIDAKNSESWPAAEEFEYEKAGLLVHAQTGDWHAVTLKEKEGWIHKGAIKAFHLYPEILKDKLAYRVPQCCVYTKPSASSDSILPVMPSSNENEDAIKVLDVRLVDGIWWINAHFLSNSPCRTDNEKIVTTGWFPAIKDGKRTAWFYSRGC